MFHFSVIKAETFLIIFFMAPQRVVLSYSRSLCNSILDSYDFVSETQTISRYLGNKGFLGDYLFIKN